MLSVLSLAYFLLLASPSAHAAKPCPTCPPRIVVDEESPGWKPGTDALQALYPVDTLGEALQNHGDAAAAGDAEAQRRVEDLLDQSDQLLVELDKLEATAMKASVSLRI